MGRVELYHGNALKFLRDMSRDAVDVVITDPPYDKSAQKYLSDLLRVADGTVVVFTNPENQWPTSDQYCFWSKPISTKNTSRRYSRFVEVIHIYCQKGSVWNADRHWSQYVNVFNDRIESNRIHTYQKPMSLMERLVLNHTHEGMCVLDPFMGSGTTGMACVRHNRKFIGIEKDKNTYLLAQQRIENAA